jgi:hypothetical protein
MTIRYRRGDAFPSLPEGLGIAPNVRMSVISLSTAAHPYAALRRVFRANGSHFGDVGEVDSNRLAARA